MLDIELIRRDPEFVKERLSTRDRDLPSLVDRVLELDGRRRRILTEIESLRAERNRKSRQIGVLKGEGKDTALLEKEVRDRNP